MINIENVEVYGWEAAIRGMRNPMNSWDKSDSIFSVFDRVDDDVSKYEWVDAIVGIGNNDLDLMTRLCNAGTEHRKFMRMINVTMDITAPLYWWKEFDTYKVGTVANSCSTMHKIHAKEFELDDFSHEQLLKFDDILNDIHEQNPDVDATNCMKYFSENDDAPVVWIHDSGVLSPEGVLQTTIIGLNKYRDLYLKTKDKKYWWQMIQLLPSSYNQKRTVQLNYEVLAGMYRQRKDHKLYEWRTFCEFLRTLPFSELIIGQEE